MGATTEHRKLSFQSLDQAVAEAGRLAGGEVRTTGKHSFGQILEHLARTHDMATGKLVGPKPPFYVRLMMPLLKSMIIKDVKPGYKLPSKAEAFFWPDQEFDVADALQHLRESVENFKTNGPLEKHPVFGKLSPEQTLELNCKHCARCIWGSCTRCDPLTCFAQQELRRPANPWRCISQTAP